MSKSTFIKSADTDVSVARSKAEVERILRRYGAAGFSVSEHYAEGKIIVTFVVDDSPALGAPKVGIKLPIEVLRVFQALNPTNRYGTKVTWTIAQATNDVNARAWAHAERVAWRNLVLWIDAALSSAACGLQTVTESLFAHAIAGANGERMIEVVEQAQGQLAPGVRALLASPAEHT